MKTNYLEKHSRAKKNPYTRPFAPFEPEVENLTYDFIVIGGGSAGSIVASNLAKNFPEKSVLMVEAGPGISVNDPVVWDPTQWVLVSDNLNLEWGYKSVPQPGLNNRVIPMGRAKGLGGCSIHNAMVYVRGGYKGFNNWASQGNTGWDYNSVLPYFQQVEQSFLITIAQTDPFVNSLINACNDQNIVYNANYNQLTDTQCVSPFQFAISQSRRETAYSAFIVNNPDPMTNLTVIPTYLVEKINIDQTNTARSVIISSIPSGWQYEISANEEIILSAGAIGSPQILMLSGVGPAEELSGFNIPVINNLQGVGQNFQDDLYVTAWFQSKQPMPVQPYGLMGAVIFANSPYYNPDLGTDIECSLAAGTMAGLNLKPDQQQSWFIYPNIQLLNSRGTVALASGNPSDAPIINPNYLSANGDLEKCVSAVQLALSVGQDSALADWYEATWLPDSTNNLEEYVRNNAGTCYHYAGTCKMGPSSDPMAVVAPDLTVYGINNLRVIDASIIPTTVSGNTAAATMMIAQKGSSLISDAVKH